MHEDINNVIGELEVLEELTMCEFLNPLLSVKTINKMNCDLLLAMKERKYTTIGEKIDKFIEENKDLFSVKNLKNQFEIENAQYKIKAVVKEEKHIEKVVDEKTLERQRRAESINKSFQDLKDIRRDLPYIYGSKNEVNNFNAKLIRFSKNYKLPMDASRSLGCLRQAEGDLNKIYDCVDSIKNSPRDCISGKIILG